ncbi:LD-carboxypeptidase [Microbacterium protaetiae]|uniref:LD-carboxypeptidase n=1 Tax=Microbacterium protaetiae TaxID=2509458 RepID=A0A4P6EC42_9MICO|nr:S66 peptidase family protein [Microbacterium protaetiae]QAY59785.1 LD-carboxypeptidase [Microbacterium protaetiae]
MPIRYPAPLVRGETVAVTSPSSGVTADERARLDVAVGVIEQRGYRVVIGDCMDGATHASAPAAQRASELNTFLTDPAIRAVIPPWGGMTAIDLLPLLDWQAITAAAPTWFIGFSDISTLLTPITLRTGIATLHGNNLMDTPYLVPDGLLGWLDIVTRDTGSSFTQISPGRFRAEGWDDYVTDPDVSSMTLDAAGSWTRLDGSTGQIDVTGRLIGGCIDTLANAVGTPFCDTATFARDHAPEGLIVYIEAADEDALTICSRLHGMRLAGFFDQASAVLVGRTAAPDAPSMTQHAAVVDALGSLGVPIIGDVECGHVQPYLPVVNGSLGRVRFADGAGSLTQTLR